MIMQRLYCLRCLPAVGLLSLVWYCLNCSGCRQQYEDITGLSVSALSCFEFLSVFQARGWVFLFVVCVCVCSCFCWSVVGVWKYKQGSSKNTLPYTPRGCCLIPTELVGNAYFSMRCRIKNPYFFDIYPVLSKF